MLLYVCACVGDDNNTFNLRQHKNIKLDWIEKSTPSY